MTRTNDNKTGRAEEPSAPPVARSLEETTGHEQSGVAKQIADLDSLSLPQLRKRWSRTFNAGVPRGLSRDLMIRGLAYKLQEQALGGLTQAAKRKLGTFAKQLEGDSRKGFEADSDLKPGAKLIREWQARTYTVTVLDDGFEFGGKRYGSLSMIAREITGVRWSGPRFFGLGKERAHAET